MGNREWETGNGNLGNSRTLGNREWETGNSRNWEADSGPELETSWTRLDLLDYMGASCPVCETVKRNTILEAKDSGCTS